MTERETMDVGEREPPRILPPHYFLLAIALMLGLALIDPSAGVLGSWRWLGAVPFVAAFAVATIARRQFETVGTEIRPLHPSSALVTDGPFRFSRNPMYASMLVGLAGVALMLDRITPWLVIPPFAALLYYRFVRHEEAHMERTFGAAYLDYKARVRRWL